MGRIRYTQGPGRFGQLISQHNSDTGQSHYYGFDAMGHTRFLADSSGSVTDTYSYKAFGEPVTSSGSTPNPMRYGGEVGYYRDKVERVYVRARQYEPPTGRWLSRDPIDFDAGDWNLYRYVFNRPLNWVDPIGLASDPGPIGQGMMRIVFDAFIPTPIADAPLLNNPILGTAGGDNRAFSSTSNRFRVRHTIVLDPKTGGCRTFHRVGRSSATPSLLNPSGSAGVQTDLSSLVTRCSYLGSCCWDVRIEGNARYPFAPQYLTPGITYQLNLQICSQKMAITGFHDFYPAYEIWKYTDNKPASLKYGFMPKGRVGGLTAAVIPSPGGNIPVGHKLIFVIR